MESEYYRKFTIDLRKCPFKEIIFDGSMGQKDTMLFFVEEKSLSYV